MALSSPSNPTSPLRHQLSLHGYFPQFVGRRGHEDPQTDHRNPDGRPDDHAAEDRARGGIFCLITFVTIPTLALHGNLKDRPGPHETPRRVDPRPSSPAHAVTEAPAPRRRTAGRSRPPNRPAGHPRPARRPRATGPAGGAAGTGRRGPRRRARRPPRRRGHHRGEVGAHRQRGDRSRYAADTARGQQSILRPVAGAT